MLAESPQPQISYDEAGNGPPLVLLHAFPQTRLMWRRQLAELSASFQVLCPDLPPVGESRSSSTCSIEGMADDIAAWLEHLSIPKATVGGVSMGGYVALALARRHPALLSGLILADTRAEPDDEPARSNRQTMIEFARHNNARALFEKMAPRLFCEGTRSEHPELIEEAAQIAVPIASESIIALIEALRDRPDARPGLASIHVPALILVGAEDEVTPPEAAQAMSAAIANSQLQVLERAGHFAHIEQALAWNRAVLDWARGVASARS